MKLYKKWFFPDNEQHFINYFKNLNCDHYQKKQRDSSVKHLKSKMTAIDIGANVGLWAVDLCKIFNQVLLFEPCKSNIECLRQNLTNYSNFKIYDCALSNREGYSSLYIDNQGSGNHSLVPNKNSQSSIERVKLKKLDNFNFNDIDYIKIDAQFHELEIIEGSINTLKNNNPVLCIEASQRNENEKAYVKKFVHILESLNFIVVGGLGKELFFSKKI